MTTPTRPDPSALVDPALLEYLEQRAAALPDAAPLFREIDRMVRAGGKRLRPAFCVWGYRAGGGGDDRSIARAAAALELLHTFAIIHDDVMDRSPLRRGQPSSHRRLAQTEEVRADAERFGASAAILVGDLAMALADERWTTSGFVGNAFAEASRVYHEMRAEVISGQFLDLLAAARGDATPEETRRISVLKSGRYTVERPLQIGAALASAAPAVRAALVAFGAPLGEAFQIRDDVLGAFGDPSVTGKDAYGDLREGKQTLLVALARRAAAPAARAVLDRALGDDGLPPAEAERLREIFRETGALDEALKIVDALVTEARLALEGTPIAPDAAAALHELADQLALKMV